MNFWSTLSTGVSAFTATNLDDMVILMLIFSQVGSLLQRRQIVSGQYLGFALLVLASLPGFFGSLLVPRPWIGLLGLVPIILGLNRLLEQPAEDEAEPTVEPSQSAWASFLSPQTYGIAALTVANGSDNVGIYVPLFAHCTGETLVLMLLIFFALVGVWCYAAYQLTRLPTIAETLTRYGNQFVPYVLIGLGAMILWDSQTLADRGLILIALLIGIGYLIGVGRMLPSQQE
ncbi:transporter [Leptolyngbya sp. NK1-12]|uniref:Transporter n=2 Tax=Leptolyngbya sp. NK1-12 TaxID=2547451 RepID=A0AA97AT02_9CYAN|nr:transporter [Leptolyngbya sp. NK1-12]